MCSPETESVLRPKCVLSSSRSDGFGHPLQPSTTCIVLDALRWLSGDQNRADFGNIAGGALHQDNPVGPLDGLSPSLGQRGFATWRRDGGLEIPESLNSVGGI